MRVIVAGSRNIMSYAEVEQAIRESGFHIDVVLSGAAHGVDTYGEYWANTNGASVERYPADWERYGNSAGYKRNVVMAERADALVAVWDGFSRGTKHMIDIAREKRLRVHVHDLSKPSLTTLAASILCEAQASSRTKS